MNPESETLSYSLQHFEPETHALYSLEAAAHLAQIGRHLVLICIKEELVAPILDPEYGGFYFTRSDLRLLRRIGHLHTTCGVNLLGVRLILDLSREVERLRNEAVVGTER